MPSISISAAHFIGIFVGAIAFGIHVITFAYCIRTLTTTRSGWRKRCDIKWPMLTVSLALFVIATFNIILDFYQALTILVVERSTTAAAEDKFLDISGWINITKVRLSSNKKLNFFLTLNFFNIRCLCSLPVDYRGCTLSMLYYLYFPPPPSSFLCYHKQVYRCWVIYDGYKPILILPILFWVTCISSTIWLVATEATLHSSGSQGAKQVRPSGVLALGLTVAINIITTSALEIRQFTTQITVLNINIRYI